MEYFFTHHKLLDKNVTLDKVSIAERSQLLGTAQDGLSQTRSVVDQVEAEVRLKTGSLVEHRSSRPNPLSG
jgi:hypothetical protein